MFEIPKATYPVVLSDKVPVSAIKKAPLFFLSCSWLLITSLLLFSKKPLYAQPVFDVIQLQFQQLPASDLDKVDPSLKTDMDFLQTQLNLPIKPGKKDVLVLNPLYERRNICFDIPGGTGFKPFRKLGLQTLSFTLSNQYTFSDSTLQLLTAAAVRHYAAIELRPAADELSPAFAVLFSKRTSARFAWKAGAYYSKEFFGNLWLPLLGLEWKINDRLWCWGIVPRYLTLDYAITPCWHSSLQYKGVTDSYRLPEGDWFSIVEGQVRWAQDFYIPKTSLMLTCDIGHSLTRKFTGYEAESFTKKSIRPSDSFIFRIALAWRAVLNRAFHVPAKAGRSG